MNYYYMEWLLDNDLEHTEETYDKWFDTHCQFCGNNIEYCDCDHKLRY